MDDTGTLSLPIRLLHSHLAAMDAALADFISPKALADLLGVSERTLQRWHQTRRGPARCQVGRTIRYRLDTVRAWLAANETRPVVRTGGRSR